MSHNLTTIRPSATARQALDDCSDVQLTLNAYTTPRLVYEIIKLYMLSNTPENVGVKLAQKFNADYKKSDILLDIGYNWKTKELSKVPAVFVQRGDLTFKTPTFGEAIAGNSDKGFEVRNAFANMPVVVTCVAAEPIAVVENLAEYVKQPLLYFRRSIQLDFGIRSFILTKMTAPKLLQEGKNNFYVDLVLDVTYDDSWTISRNALKLKRIGIDLFDEVNTPLQQAVI